MQNPLMPDACTTPPGPVLEAYGATGASVRPLGNGLINQTFVVDAGALPRFVLQRLHPIFQPEVNADIEAVTRHLAARGLVTPRLLPTRGGELWVVHEGSVWRALTWVDGVGLDCLDNAAEAREAGALLGRFHVAVSDLNHAFRSVRLGVHDTARHLDNLRSALATHASHPRFAAVRPLAQEILAAAARLEPLPAAAGRIVHGDPKVNNILFTPDRSRAICLIDLDTLAHMALPLELGDALRSWCNPAGEDGDRASFSLDLFAAAVEGYAAEAGSFATPTEWGSFVAATETIYIELAARFCADALNESYFGWNPEKFASRSEHNQARAQSQVRAARSLGRQRDAAQAAVRDAFT
jgi:Ser/Thr protein kinase RdoA (MazF antagonist)